MNDEKQPDLPGIPTPPSGEGTPIHGIENLLNAPPLEWGEPIQPGTARPTEAVPASGPKAGGPNLEHKAKPARESRSRNARENPVKEPSDGTEQSATASKPIRKRAASTKDALAAEQAHLLAADEPAPVLPARKPAHRSRKATAKSAMVEKAESIAAAQASTTTEDVPPVTEEAIAFLRNPDAKAIDIFKLGADSRAFVEYHIKNLQRIEAHGEKTRRALDATAPKFSPRFEKVVDTLQAGREKRNAVEALPRAEPRAAAPVERTDADYGLKRTGGHAPRPVKVQMGKMEIATAPAASTQPTRAMQMVSSNAKYTDAKTVDSQIENVIERGIPREIQDRPSLAKFDILDQTAAHASMEGDFAHGFGKQVMRTIGGIAQSAGIWLQSKAEGATSPLPSFGSPLPRKRSAGKTQPSTDDLATPVPETVTRRFLKVEQNYYFPDKTHAFSDHGNRLATRGSHPEVVRSLVEIAKARGWESITVKGSDEFRQSAWMEAAASGLQVAGYKPTKLDLAELAQRPPRNAVEAEVATEHAKSIKTAGSKAVPEPVQATAAHSRTPTATSKDKSRERGSELVEKARSFANDKPVLAVKKHPDLAPGYGIVDAAKKFAEANLPKSAREEFIGLARRHIIQKIIAGENVKGPQIYSTHQNTKDEPVKDNGPGIQSPVEGKPPRTKEVARER